jgi:hypothetical protein
MSSRGKRSAADTAGSTPTASKQRRVDGNGTTPATAARPHGRIVLNVGGQRFESSRTTLEGSSSYFHALLQRWDDATEEPLFIDCDADAFAVLLSHMRISSSVTLPKDNEELCIRVLLLAEYLGMEGFLAKVKAKAYSNMQHPDATADDPVTDDPVAAFDGEVGALQVAIDSGVLPARFFGPAPKPPLPPPEKIIKTLIPSPAGYTARFQDDSFDGDQDHYYEIRDVICFAAVQLRDGTTRVDAVVQRNEEDAALNEGEIKSGEADPQLANHLAFASDVKGWEHHLILPPPSTARMLPVPPGTLRGVWAKPALTDSDKGKMLTVTESGAIIVGGEVRSVTWGDREIPTSIKDRKIRHVISPQSRTQLSLEGWRGGINTDCPSYIQVPYLTGAANQVFKDIVCIESGRGDAEGAVPSKFFIGDSLGARQDVFRSNRLVDVTTIRMPNAMEFSHVMSVH